MTDSTTPVIIPKGISVYTIPRRSYDFNKGDRRFWDLDEAIEWANDEARRTGIRQMIRHDSPVLDRDILLVQAVGS